MTVRTASTPSINFARPLSVAFWSDLESTSEHWRNIKSANLSKGIARLVKEAYRQEHIEQPRMKVSSKEARLRLNAYEQVTSSVEASRKHLERTIAIAQSRPAIGANLWATKWFPSLQTAHELLKDALFQLRRVENDQAGHIHSSQQRKRERNRQDWELLVLAHGYKPSHARKNAIRDSLIWELDQFLASKVPRKLRPNKRRHLIADFMSILDESSSDSWDDRKIYKILHSRSAQK